MKMKNKETDNILNQKSFLKNIKDTMSGKKLNKHVLLIFGYLMENL